MFSFIKRGERRGIITGGYDSSHQLSEDRGEDLQSQMQPVIFGYETS